MKNLWKLFLTALVAFVAFGCADDDDDAAAVQLAAGEMEVRGYLIDVRNFTADAELFPQHKGYTIPAEAEGLLDGAQVYAVSVADLRGPESFRVGSDGMVYMASDIADLTSYGWRKSSASFKSGHLDFYLHSRHCKAGEWVEVPYVEGEQTCSSMLFAKKIRVEAPAAPGVVIAKMADDGFKNRHITNVNIHILPDGSYLALCTNATGYRSTDIFRSTDGGESWSLWSNQAMPMNFTRMFEHNGALYLMGTLVENGRLIICKSEDNGKTWTTPDPETGYGYVVSDRSCHHAPCSMAIYDGRIWRGMEQNGDPIKPFAISAPVDSDLLDPASWERTNISTNTEGWVMTNGDVISQLIEGNVVVGPDGKLYNLLRADCSRSANHACLARIEPGTGSFKYELQISEDDFITFPGGNKKFTVLYDEPSQRYWTITNPAHERGQAHSGIYANGVSYGLTRNKMVLCYSYDLKKWVQYKTIVYDKDPWFHGFQYVDWKIDGDDIVAVSRTACPEERGLPIRQHDANMMTFHRIKNFRTL